VHIRDQEQNLGSFAKMNFCKPEYAFYRPLKLMLPDFLIENFEIVSAANSGKPAPLF
jgi:hypothetical protein